MTAGPTERGFLTFEGRKGRETVQRKKDGHVLPSPFSLWKEFPIRHLWGTFLEARTRGRNLHDDGNRFSKFCGAVNQSCLQPLFGTSVLDWTHFLCKVVSKSFL